jgi:two-component system OmpR family response regulator
VQILIIEDDPATALEIGSALVRQGEHVTHLTDGQLGLQAALQGQFDLIITDRMLPQVDGLTILQTLRERGVATPVLVLSALATVDDRVRGLRAGGDDYLGKPFVLEELLARVESLLRRSATSAATQLKVDDLEMDLLRHRVTRAGREIPLTMREFRLLEFLMRNAGHVVTRTMLLQAVWDIHFDPETNIIDVHVSRLRQAIDRDFDHSLLHTVRGTGYVLRAAASGAPPGE